MINSSATILQNTALVQGLRSEEELIIMFVQLTGGHIRGRATSMSAGHFSPPGQGRPLLKATDKSYNQVLSRPMVALSRKKFLYLGRIRKSQLQKRVFVKSSAY